MAEQPVKYYQKGEPLSQQAALVSQPPARVNVSNPPPLWGLKFLLSTSGPGLGECRHSLNSVHTPALFLPYGTLPAAFAGSHGFEPAVVRPQLPNTSHPEWLFTALLSFCVCPVNKNSPFIPVVFLKGMTLLNRRKSEHIVRWDLLESDKKKSDIRIERLNLDSMWTSIWKYQNNLKRIAAVLYITI